MPSHPIPSIFSCGTFILLSLQVRRLFQILIAHLVGLIPNIIMFDEKWPKPQGGTGIALWGIFPNIITYEEEIFRFLSLHLEKNRPEHTYV